MSTQLMNYQMNIIVSENFLKLEKNESSFKIALEKLRGYTKKMFEEAVLYKETGGMHCAGIADKEALLIVREDVGRHNAVDKVIGKSFFLELDFNQSLVLTTGRISSDMVLKAVAGRIPIIASRSIPTSFAIEIAERASITVVGRVLTKEPIVYTQMQRIVCNNEKF